MPIPVVLGSRKTRSPGIPTRTGSLETARKGNMLLQVPFLRQPSASALTVRRDATQGGHRQPDQRAPQHQGPPAGYVRAARRPTEADRSAAWLRKVPAPATSHLCPLTLRHPRRPHLLQNKLRLVTSPKRQPLTGRRRPTGGENTTLLRRRTVRFSPVATPTLPVFFASYPNSALFHTLLSFPRHRPYLSTKTRRGTHQRPASSLFSHISRLTAKAFQEAASTSCSS